MTTNSPEYTICLLCDHFVELNDSDPWPGVTLAEYVHLDNGEKEHDHDARPTPGASLAIETWRAIKPELFTEYRDGAIGPNSAHYTGRS